MEVIDNFLPDDEFVLLRELLIGENSEFPGYCSPWVDYAGSGLDGEGELHNCQMFHWLLRPWDSAPSPFLTQVVGPIVKVLNSSYLYGAKANLQFRSPSVVPMVFHKDVGEVQCRTVVFYVTGTDGPTVFADGTEVQSVANRALVFDSQLLHCSSTHTNSKVRCVVNVNCL